MGLCRMYCLHCSNEKMTVLLMCAQSRNSSPSVNMVTFVSGLLCRSIMHSLTLVWSKCGESRTINGRYNARQD